MIAIKFKVQSKIIYNDANPQWNQELRMGIKFPSMCNKIKIAVKDWYIGYDS